MNEIGASAALYVSGKSLGHIHIEFCPIVLRLDLYLIREAYAHVIEVGGHPVGGLPIEEVKAVLGLIADYKGEMPGASEIECGNYRNLDVELAKAEARSYLAKIASETEKDLEYETGE